MYVLYLVVRREGDKSIVAALSLSLHAAESARRVRSLAACVILILSPRHNHLLDTKITILFIYVCAQGGRDTHQTE